MAELGHEVLGVDIDAEKVKQLSIGRAPFYEPGLDEILDSNIAKGRLRFTTSYQEAADFGQVHFIAVATPQQPGKLAADLTYVESVLTDLVPILQRSTIIFGKSTVPVGTSASLTRLIDSLAPSDITVELAWNPEFLREGFAVHDTLHPDRILLGVDTYNIGVAESIGRDVYSEILQQGVPFLVTNRETAELTKVAANAFLATKISFINTLAEICEIAGADVVELADAMGYDTRIGRRFLNAGVGFGGGCLPKDLRALMARADELRVSQASALLHEVDNINSRCRTRTVDNVRELLGGSFIGKKMAVLGAAFKPSSDDIRDSPALEIADRMRSEGGAVSVYDPKALSNARLAYPELDYADNHQTACNGADLLLVLTEWEEFRLLDPTELNNVVRSRLVFDGRNCLDRAKWEEAGWSYRGIARR